MRRARGLIAVLIFSVLAGPAAALTADTSRLAFPDDPLRSSLGLSFGTLRLENQAYRDFFGVSELESWTLRYDYRVWRSLRLGAAVSATNKSHLARDVSIDSEAYPVRFNFSAFQGMGEIYLRTQLPRIMFFDPHLSAGRVISRVHAESSGYTGGYEAFWEEFPIVEEVIQTSGGWRYAIGAQFNLWANINILLEASSLSLDSYDEPTDANPPVGHWDHSGTRLEAGLLQRF